MVTSNVLKCSCICHVFENNKLFLHKVKDNFEEANIEPQLFCWSGPQWSITKQNFMTPLNISLHRVTIKTPVLSESVAMYLAQWNQGCILNIFYINEPTVGTQNSINLLSIMTNHSASLSKSNINYSFINRRDTF